MKPRVVFMKSMKPKRKILDRGSVYGNPLHIEAKTKRFESECRKFPKISSTLLSARRYTRWIVATSGSRVYIAPVNYALFNKTSIQVLQHATKGDLVAEGGQEMHRIEELPEGALYNRALKKIKALTKRPDDIYTLYVPLQRCLYSADTLPGANEFKKWSALGFKAPTPRLNSRDDAVRHEESERTKRDVRSLVADIIRQRNDLPYADGRFERGHHLRLVYQGESGAAYAFICRALTLNNLHVVLRDVLSEALEYRYRYQNTVEFVVALSMPISETNTWVVRILNQYNIIVATRNYSSDAITIVGKLGGPSKRDLAWLTGPSK